MKTSVLHASLIASLSLLSAGIAIAQDGPSGPSSLTETYQDWRVACTGQDKSRRCAFSQQLRQQDGRRVLAVEFIPARDGGLTGTMVLPFGLALDKGLTIGLDDAAPSPPLPFKTCLPAGCIVPITVSAAAAKGYRDGTTLKLNTVASDTGKPMAFSLSMKGFLAALNRTSALLR